METFHPDCPTTSTSNYLLKTKFPDRPTNWMFRENRSPPFTICQHENMPTLRKYDKNPRRRTRESHRALEMKNSERRYPSSFLSTPTEKKCHSIVTGSNIIHYNLVLFSIFSTVTIVSFATFYDWHVLGSYGGNRTVFKHFILEIPLIIFSEKIPNVNLY